MVPSLEKTKGKRKVGIFSEDLWVVLISLEVGILVASAKHMFFQYSTYISFIHHNGLIFINNYHIWDGVTANSCYTTHGILWI